jgi:hypothetical protein
MRNQMNSRRATIWFTLIVLIVIAGILAGVWAAYSYENRNLSPFSPFDPRSRPEFNPADLQFYYIARTVFSTINIALLIVLTETYAALYYKTRSQFTIGLLIFALVFLMKEITSSPIVLGVFRFSLSGLGPFALIEPLLETAGLSVLLYLSIEY